jgi:hypothetical protein
VLTSLLSRDNTLPHFFGVRDSRLVFGNGVGALAVFSAALLVAVGGNTNTLIPLFAIGVFVGFTLCQAGLVVHWRRTREPGWTWRATINGVGAAVTATAAAIFLVTKFTEGAWAVVLAIPLLMVLFNRIEVYYSDAAEDLGIDLIPGPLVRKRTLVVVPVTSVSRLTHHVLSEAISLGDEVMAVTVTFDGVQVGLPDYQVERKWQEWSPGVPLRVLHTEFASIVQPIARLVDELRADTECHVAVLIPVGIPRRLRYRLLHNQVDLALAAELHKRPDVIVARVPMPIMVKKTHRRC